MKLVIMRHGQAEMQAESDSSRQLTKIGGVDVRSITRRLCQKLEMDIGSLVPPAIYHSPYVRTTQTAELAHTEITQACSRLETNIPEIKAADILVGSHSPRQVTEWLSQFNPPLLMLISHQPLVSSLVDWLVEGSSAAAQNHYSQYSMAPASIAVLEGSMYERGLCELDFMLHA